MCEELDKIKLKMKALGFSQQQIDAIIKQAYSGKKWEKMSKTEKEQMLKSMDERIMFARKVFQLVSCKNCCK